MANTFKIIEGDSLIKLKEFADNSIDSVVTDPPYGLGKEPDIREVMKGWLEKGFYEVKAKGGFMGHKWDAFVPQPILWEEVYRVLKHGGYMLVACGTRTQDWMTSSLRFAGFEVVDIITWHYGSGFAKGLDISKAIDKKAGATRKVIGVKNNTYDGSIRHPENHKSPSELSNIGEWGLNHTPHGLPETAPSTDEAKTYSGYNTQLKPATEFWTVCRKPLSEKTFALNVLKHGTGAFNIDGCRIATDETITNHSRSSDASISKGKYGDSKEQNTHQTKGQKQGRFPANVIFDDFTGKILDEQSGILTTGAMKKAYEYQNNGTSFGKPSGSTKMIYDSNKGGASRFFYCAKPSQKERNKGTKDGNKHSTVKPIKLMRYLIRLITPPNGVCLDPFNGSGTTGIGCMVEGFDYIGIDSDKESCETSIDRITAWKKEIDEVESELTEEDNQLNMFE